MTLKQNRGSLIKLGKSLAMIIPKTLTDLFDLQAKMTLDYEFRINESEFVIHFPVIRNGKPVISKNQKDILLIVNAYEPIHFTQIIQQLELRKIFIRNANNLINNMIRDKMLDWKIVKNSKKIIIGSQEVL